MLRPKAIPSSLATWRLSLHQPRRHFAAPPRPSPSSRSYFYDVDIHGQLFLSDAKHRNVATAYRDVRFLDTFFTRIRRNDHLIATEEAREARLKGYEFVSECMGEINYVRPDPEGTAVVFQALDGAGSLSLPFDPAALRVDTSTGYLFHPSPVSKRSKRSHVGPYSLLRSSLVLDHFGPSLDLDPGTGGGGSFEYAGRRFRIEPLQEGDVWRRVRSEETS
ncbi:hypothetical protein C6P46_005468 [Rhodotorula mucilaginosa]|uniref:Uncharacterized protein n=1 Tax=Rhodotorula mucilaginosa TaxID=5537 RepID=A0A9P6W995_RHOMI|nr:hypothetical protein C6P46_005468 [Rhodotorula mucilaginosa]